MISPIADNILGGLRVRAKTRRDKLDNQAVNIGAIDFNLQNMVQASVRLWGFVFEESNLVIGVGEGHNVFPRAFRSVAHAVEELVGCNGVTIVGKSECKMVVEIGERGKVDDIKG